MENMFVKASKQKLRFKVGNGNASTEDLWDLTLDQLDTLAIGYSKDLKETEGLSFIKPKTNRNASLQLKFEITKFVIETKMAEADARKLRQEREAKRAQILELMQKKELSALENKSLDELQKEYDLLLEPAVSGA